MDRRRFLELGATAAVSGFLGGGMANYILPKWEKSELKRHIRGIQENMVSLKTNTKYLVTYIGEEKEDEKVLFGEGVIWENYILTADHVINLTEKSFAERLKKILGERGGKFIPRTFIFDKHSEHTILDGERLEEKLHFPEKDIGIIPYEDPVKSNYKVRLGNSDELDLMDELYVIGRPDTEYLVSKPGVVTSEKKKRINSLMPGEIVTSHRVIPGDSGSPLINQKGEVMGIVSRYAEGSHTVSIPINEFKKEINKYESSKRK